MEFVKCFTPVIFPIFSILLEKKRVNCGILSKKNENIGYSTHLFWSNCQSFFQPEKYYHCRPTEIFSRKSGPVTSDQQCDFPWNVESCICFNTRCHILITHGVISRSAESILSDTTIPMQWTWHYNKSCFLLCTFCLLKERALHILSSIK